MNCLKFKEISIGDRLVWTKGNCDEGVPLEDLNIFEVVKIELKPKLLSYKEAKASQVVTTAFAPFYRRATELEIALRYDDADLLNKLCLGPAAWKREQEFSALEIELEQFFGERNIDQRYSHLQITHVLEQMAAQQRWIMEGHEGYWSDSDTYLDLLDSQCEENWKNEGTLEQE